jgi:photosystem II stability/assembly factor-like uncharacterized protein
MTTRFFLRLTSAVLLSAAVSVSALAQKKPAAKPAAKTEATAAATTAAPESKPVDILESMKFRNLGPAVGGGRVAAVTGVPGQPNVYYIGAGGGGVWKTVDGGFTWKPIFEKEATASIGAIALAPSNPNLVWVGTGEANPRNDVITGKGIYFSPDGGQSWKQMGLENAGQITSIIVHPANPDVVYAGVLGHVWGPNQERGVFKTTDGGKTWQKVLYVDDKTGVSDLAMDPSNPMVLFAGMWQMQRYPWMLDSGGDNSAIYRSTDGGATWKKLTEGLPKGPIGRIGLAIAPTNPDHVYALVNAKTRGGLYDSNDLGEHWKLVSSDSRLIYRGFYFTTLYVSPDSENHIYFLSFSILESFDGGKTAQVIGRGVHPDHHSLWIDPQNPQRLIEGNDGGVFISADAGKTWRFLDNIPIEQFYMVAFDDARPYLLCGGLQDNNGWCGPSATLGGRGISGAEWWTATGGDGEYIVPAGNKSGIVYAESQNGSIQRLNSKDGVSDQIRPYLHGVTDMAPKDLKYRFNWTSPIAVSPTDPKTVFIGGNVLFKSTDSGTTWQPISPDLTRNDKAKQLPSGGPVELDMSGAETFDTILSLDISSTDQNVIWVGTDDGLVQVTRDGGKTWANVTPKGVPEWGRLQQIEVSPFSPDTAYVALDYHEVDNNKPYVFKTHDGGKTWTAINNGLPPNDPARVVRENPNKKGMLVLGTDTGLFYSYDEGEHWTPIKTNFPTAPVYDIQFHKQNHDLLVATHGRGLFVLDDITPLEETTPQVLAQDFHLYPSQPGVRWRPSNRRGSGLGDFVAPNPPQGVTITYYLAEEVAGGPGGRGNGPGGAAFAGGRGMGGQAGGPGGFGGPGGMQRGPVKIVITDANGQPVNTIYGPGKKGLNRVQWNMRYADARRLTLNQRPEDPEMAEMRAAFGFGGGPAAVPGTYRVAVTAKGKTENIEVQVQPDPRFPFDTQVAQTQLKTALEVRGWVSALNEALNRVGSLRSQITTVQRLLAPDEEGGEQMAAYRPVLEQARALQRKLTGFEEKIYNPELANDAAGRLHALARFHDNLQGVYRAVMQPYNQAPSALVQDEMTEVRKNLDACLAEFNELLKTDITNFNKLALEKGANTLFAGNPVELKSGATTSGAGQEEDDQ